MRFFFAEDRADERYGDSSSTDARQMICLANSVTVMFNYGMRKLFLWSVPILLVLCVLIGTAYLYHENTEALTRSQMLATELQKLSVGTSNYKAAQEIATRFGTGRYENDWGTRDCTDGYFERCAYMIPLENPTVSSIVTSQNRFGGLMSKHPWLPHVGVSEWGGRALIYINNGTVKEYSFWIMYRASNGQLRGFGAAEGMTLPTDRAVQAVISESYSIERDDIRTGSAPKDLGFSLDSSLTPVAPATERKRAWNFNFKCLAQPKGCGEICEVMPDGWRDFYTNRGHFDVEKYGSAYLFCAKPPS